ARIADVPRQPIRAKPQAAIAGDTEHGSGLILLVDDDDDVRAVVAAMLDEAGYQVVETGSGGAALECLERHAGRITLMIADIAIAGMRGGELGAAVRIAQPDLPILFITGFAGAALPPTDSRQDRLLRKP